jgi:hypothetical protein
MRRASSSYSLRCSPLNCSGENAPTVIQSNWAAKRGVLKMGIPQKLIVTFGTSPRAILRTMALANSSETFIEMIASFAAPMIRLL